jgi:hypothetical protein
MHLACLDPARAANPGPRINPTDSRVARGLTTVEGSAPITAIRHEFAQDRILKLIQGDESSPI